MTTHGIETGPFLPFLAGGMSLCTSPPTRPTTGRKSAFLTIYETTAKKESS